jgi:methionyl-tRNA synthetase
MSEKQKFYLTTPIYYVNARPHIGHAYTTIVADVLARRHRLLGDDTFFLTGTDEHGQKIERSAAAAGIAPQKFADQVSASFEGLWKRMGITNDAYIRTTDPKHQRGVQKLFADLYERGFIELRNYTGQYSIGEEMFVEGPPGTIGPDGKPTETVTEENFFFKLSEFQEPLIDLIVSQELAVEPFTRRNEVLSFLAGNYGHLLQEHFDLSPQAEGLQPNIEAAVEWCIAKGSIKRSKRDFLYVPGTLKDLSISRSSFTWGIPVPEPAASAAAQKHVIYVWLDALANYMTAIGYGSDEAADEEQFAKYWPADLHLVGKEIIRFHCVYWPAFLLAAGIPLPKAITAHGWLLFDNSKMSKSKGNIVRTETILDSFGDHVYGKQFPESTKSERDLFASDVLRYFLLREIPFGQDGSFSFEAMITRYTAELTNGYGNFVSRSLSMIEKYRESTVTERFDIRGLLVLTGNIADLQSNFSDLIASNDFSKALELTRQIIATVDVYVSAQSPWRLAKADVGRDAEIISEVLYVAVEAIRIVTSALYPFIPYATAKVWTQLGLGDIDTAARNGELKNLEWGGLKPGTKLGPLAPIFPRADKGLTQIMIDMENENSPAATPSEPSTPSPEPSARPVTSLNAGETSTFSTVVPVSRFDPAAGPRTSGIEEPAAGLHVGGSAAITTERPTAPSHTEATPSGVFASVASQTPVSAGPADASPQIAIDDFAKIELRVAEIKVAERIPKADKLLRLEVDLGYERRQILSGIAEWYTPEELVGRRIVVITNLAPRKMRGLESHGMLLAASEGEGGKPVLATFGEEIALGSRLK